MSARNTLLCLAVAGLMGVPVAHADGINFNVEVAPPAPVQEYFAPRPGYVVVPGYYQYDDHQHKHVWVKGHYEAERHGEHYVAPEWREHEGRYGLSQGHWEKDR